MLERWSIDDAAFLLPGEQFSNAVNDLIISCNCRVDESVLDDDISISIEKADLGGLSLYKYSSKGVHSAHRTSEHVRNDVTDDVMMYIPLTSSYAVRQNGCEIDLAYGTAAFVRLDQPLVGTFFGRGSEPATGANVRLPLSLLRDRLPRIDDCMREVIPLERGAGRLMLSLLESVFVEAKYLDERTSCYVGSAVLDAVCSVGHNWLTSSCALDDPHLHGSRNLMRQRIDDFILENLGQQNLSPSLIARHCNASLRSVHLAFEGSGWTIMSWIKEQRLLRCRRDLQERELAQRSVAEIAYRWGFGDVAHFSRAYKARFLSPPSADRAKSLSN